MISLYDVLEAANGQLFGEPAAQLFTGFCLDSRRIEPSQLYVAIKTPRGDGHQFIQDAVAGGATGVLCVQPPEFDTTDVSVIIVKDAEAALMAWASYVLRKLNLPVVAVGGSSGKSVTLEGLRRILSARYRVYQGGGQDGSFALPLSLANLSRDTELILLELDAQQPGQMATMVNAVKPSVAVITQIGHAHIGSFETIEQSAEEQRILIESLPKHGLAVINNDDELLLQLAGKSAARVQTVGLERFGADYMAYNIVVGLTQTGFDLRRGSERFIGRWTPLLGKHQLYSILGALVVGDFYHVPLEESLRLVTDMQPLPGRMNPLAGINNSILVDDTYNANPETSIAALEWLKTVTEPEGRTVFVSGDMDDLGSYRQRGHRQVGQFASEVASIIITQGASASLIARAALDQGQQGHRVQTTYSAQDTIASLLSLNPPLNEQDIILVKGSASARMELVVQALLNNEADRELLPRQDLAWDMSTLFQPVRPSWVEIDQGVIGNNVRVLKSIVGTDVTLMAVIKANAYGHGAVATGITALRNGAEWLAVASMAEALELRDAGIDAPMLVMSYTPPYLVHQAIRQNITVTLYDLELARAYERAAREIKGTLKVHVKIDTGMGRLGVLADDSTALFRYLRNMQHLDIEGIMTHFSMADEDATYTAEQVKMFKRTVNSLRAGGFSFKYVHAANSAGVLIGKENHFNMVRPGIALYGLHPSPHVPLPDGFLPAMTWKTVVAQVKTLPSGHGVGYGATYRTRGEERIAILPIGYSDGFRRSPSNPGRVLIHGQYAPVVGRVSMEKTAIDVSQVPGVVIGDEVVLMGRQGDNAITAEDMADALDTSNYEVVCNILARVARG